MTHLTQPSGQGAVVSASADGQFWIVESGDAAYAFGVAHGGLLVHTYWGKRLPFAADYPRAALAPFRVFESTTHNTPQEVPTGEGGDSNEPALACVWGKGTHRGLVLRFESARLEGQTVAVRLIDQTRSIKVDVTIGALGGGLFSRKLSIANGGEQAATFGRIFTGSLHLPIGGQYALTHFDGRWADEFVRQRKPIDHGTFARESRRLTTSHRSMPFFAADRDQPGASAGEEHGEVWFGALEWSGNWKLIAERVRTDRTIVHLGLNDADFALDLEPGEGFDAPAMIFGYTGHGYGAMSRVLHDHIRDRVAPRRNYVPQVVYNSWMATSFHVDEANQVRLAEKAAGIGVELFVVDDGWFAGRTGDDAGLGDWYADPTKFPDGLLPLSTRVHALGMKFGLWVEPEMVNPNSNLYRAHPNWVLHYPDRERTTQRNQLILNMGRRDVQDHLIATISSLISDAGVDFIKWDMNRSVTEAGWPGTARDGREVWVRYVEGLYHVWDELRLLHPHVIWENCSGGGGRVDLGMAARTEQTWISDNTDACARLQIQNGYSLVFPASTMGSWVSDIPFPADFDAVQVERGEHYSLDYRFHVAMSGALGIGADLRNWTDDELAIAEGHIADYKQLRGLTTAGDLYRIETDASGPWTAFLHVAKDKREAALFVFKMQTARIAPAVRLRLNGLAPEALYRIGDEIRSGIAWSQVGLEVSLRRFESRIIGVTQVGDDGPGGVTEPQ